MYDDIQHTGRVGQTDYWIWFALNIVLTLACVGFASYAVLTGNIFVGVMLFLFIFPIGIFFRVIMMRRCRDINWPAFLPWAMLGLGFVVNLLFGPRPTIGYHMSAAALIIPMIVSLLDFLFVIVIGCIPTATSSFNYETEYEKYAREYGVKENGVAQPAARAVAQPESRAVAQPGAPRSAELARPVGGFGRKNV